MKKIVLSAIVICLGGLSNFSFAHWMIPGGPMPISENGCCSYHGGVKYISSEGAVLCTDGTLSSCHGTQGSEICEGVSNYTDKDFLNISRVRDKDSRLKKLFEYIQERLRELHSIGIKIRGQSTGAGESLIAARVARAEANIRDQYCESRDTFITLAQGYILDDKITRDLSVWDNTSFGREIVSNVERNRDTIGELLKKGDRAYRSERFSEAIENYEEAVQYLRPDERFSELVADVDHAIRIAKRKLAKKQIEEEEIKNHQVKQSQASPQVESAKVSLGSKASILESLVPIIKSKDSETQQKVSLILESFKTSKDEYTRNVGIYLSYLLG